MEKEFKWTSLEPLSRRFCVFLPANKLWKLKVTLYWKNTKQKTHLLHHQLIWTCKKNVRWNLKEWDGNESWMRTRDRWGKCPTTSRPSFDSRSWIRTTRRRSRGSSKTAKVFPHASNTWSIIDWITFESNRDYFELTKPNLDWPLRSRLRIVFSLVHLSQNWIWLTACTVFTTTNSIKAQTKTVHNAEVNVLTVNPHHNSNPRCLWNPMSWGSYTKIGFLKDILCYQGFDQDYSSILELYKTKKTWLGSLRHVWGRVCQPRITIAE